MMIDRSRLESILAALGAGLEKPTRITIVGSSAAMISGQDDRQTPAIDVWQPTSDFDVADLRVACTKSGLLYDPKGHIKADDLYIQILRPGITMFPRTFETTELGRYGNLTVDMPPVELVVATKLARASETDLEDAAWWVANSSVSRDAIEEAIKLIPQAANRESARENLIFMDVVMFEMDENLGS